MKAPWLIVGTAAGVIAMGLLLPAVSDATGITQTFVILLCLFGGLLFGIGLDCAFKPRRPP